MLNIYTVLQTLFILILSYCIFPCAAVLGRNFIAVNMTFENTAGPKGGQAVTLLSQSDLSVFYRCGITLTVSSTVSAK